MSKRYEKKIPKFKSEDEEREFWATKRIQQERKSSGARGFKV